jgi:hypothetical protein
VATTTPHKLSVECVALHYTYGSAELEFGGAHTTLSMLLYHLLFD